MLVKGRRSLRECSNVRLWVGRYTEAALALLVVGNGVVVVWGEMGR